ncbi:MAG: response regulator, partial [Moheibacter sp.]
MGTRIKHTVIVIEDDTTLLDTYRYYFSLFDNFTLKGTYRSIPEALSEYEEIYPNIIISDISMPEISGIEGIKLFKELDSSVKILMVSLHDDLGHVMESIKNMADGYITKPINKKSLKNALNSLVENGAPLSTDVSRTLIQVFQKEKNKMFSDREHEILELFTKGYTYKDMADKLYVTTSTINFHIQNIYMKLDVT